MQQIESMAQNKKLNQIGRPLICNNILAGCESSGGNTLLADFILFAQKLEKLGFTYHKGKVTILDPAETL